MPGQSAVGAYVGPDLFFNSHHFDILPGDNHSDFTNASRVILIGFLCAATGYQQCDQKQYRISHETDLQIVFSKFGPGIRAPTCSLSNGEPMGRLYYYREG